MAQGEHQLDAALRDTWEAICNDVDEGTGVVGVAGSDERDDALAAPSFEEVASGPAALVSWRWDTHALTPHARLLSTVAAQLEHAPQLYHSALRDLVAAAVSRQPWGPQVCAAYWADRAAFFAESESNGSSSSDDADNGDDNEPKSAAAPPRDAMTNASNKTAHSKSSSAHGTNSQRHIRRMAGKIVALAQRNQVTCSTTSPSTATADRKRGRGADALPSGDHATWRPVPLPSATGAPSRLTMPPRELPSEATTDALLALSNVFSAIRPRPVGFPAAIDDNTSYTPTLAVATASGSSWPPCAYTLLVTAPHQPPAGEPGTASLVTDALAVTNGSRTEDDSALAASPPPREPRPGTTAEEPGDVLLASPCAETSPLWVYCHHDDPRAAARGGADSNMGGRFVRGSLIAAAAGGDADRQEGGAQPEGVGVVHVLCAA